MVTRIFPNRYQPDHQVLADKSSFVPWGPPARPGVEMLLGLPGNTFLAPYQIRTKHSMAEEFMIVVASTRQWKPEPGQPEGPFEVFRGEKDQERLIRTRDVVLEDVRPQSAARASVAEQWIPFRIKHR
jgi:hypothetical protein